MNRSIFNKQAFLYIPAYLCFNLFLLSCTGTTGKKSTEKKNTQQQQETRRKPPASYQDSLVIDFMAAVLYSPDSLQLEKIEHLLTPGEYESSVHECAFLLKNARTSLRENWPRIKTIEVTKVRYLVFIKTDNSRTLIDLDTKDDMCGVFLFNRVKDPLQADMMNIGSALDYYFKK